MFARSMYEMTLSTKMSGMIRHRAPRDEYARNPQASAEASERHVARNFEQEVADEKHARRESERLAAERQLRVHLQSRVADVRAIDVRDDVENEDERNDP